MKTGIGQPVRRKEDARLLVGAGRFSADVDLPRKARALVIVSVHAHARFKGVAPERARVRKGAAHVVKLECWVQRVTGVPMEPRSAVGSYDKQSGRYFIHAGSGGVVRQKGELAAMLAVKPEEIRVVSYDIGGNFGTKNSIFPEFSLVLWAAKRIGRPVKWTCERGEAFLSDYQGRDL